MKRTFSIEPAVEGGWTAVDDNTYDGPSSLLGIGVTPLDALLDLLQQEEDTGKDTYWQDQSAGERQQ